MFKCIIGKKLSIIVRGLAKIWLDEILTLSSIAETRPHSTYCAFVHGAVPRWNYVMRTIESEALCFNL